MEFKTKEELVSKLRSQLQTSEAQAVKGLLRIYSQQTASEKQTGSVHVNNGVGFTTTDSKTYSIVASIIEQRNKKGTVTAKQQNVLDKNYAKVLKGMDKYAGQLIDLAIADGVWKKSGNKWVSCDQTKVEKPIVDDSGAKDDIYWSNRFADWEREQEAKAFLNDPYN